MPADPAKLRIFADESVLGLGKALAIARDDTVHAGHPLVPTLPVGALDTEWIPEVAKLGLVVIARDRHIKTKPAELTLLKAHGLRVMWIAGKKDLKTWGYLSRLVRRWGDIDEIIATRETGPWFYAINETNVAELVV